MTWASRWLCGRSHSVHLQSWPGRKAPKSRLVQAPASLRGPSSLGEVGGEDRGPEQSREGRPRALLPWSLSTLPPSSLSAPHTPGPHLARPSLGAVLLLEAAQVRTNLAVCERLVCVGSALGGGWQPRKQISWRSGVHLSGLGNELGRLCQLNGEDSCDSHSTAPPPCPRGLCPCGLGRTQGSG